MGAHKHNPTAQAVAAGFAACYRCGEPTTTKAKRDAHFVHGYRPVYCGGVRCAKDPTALTLPEPSKVVLVEEPHLKHLVALTADLPVLVVDDSDADRARDHARLVEAVARVRAARRLR